MEKTKQMGTHPRRLSNHQKIKLMKLACSLPQDLNGAGWKAHYKEMVELITGMTIQPEEKGVVPCEYITLTRGIGMCEEQLCFDVRAWGKPKNTEGS